MQGTTYDPANVEEMDAEYKKMFSKMVPYNEDLMFKALADKRTKNVKVTLRNVKLQSKMNDKLNRHNRNR